MVAHTGNLNTGKSRLEDQGFKSILGYIVNLRSVGLHETLSKISRKEERKRGGGRKEKDVKGVWGDSFYVVHELLGIFLLSCDCLRDKHCSLRTGPPLGE